MDYISKLNRIKMNYNQLLLNKDTACWVVLVELEKLFSRVECEFEKLIKSIKVLYAEEQFKMATNQSIFSLTPSLVRTHTQISMLFASLMAKFFDILDDTKFLIMQSFIFLYPFQDLFTGRSSSLLLQEHILCQENKHHLQHYKRMHTIQRILLW